jgi:hypothetical protein
VQSPVPPKRERERERERGGMEGKRRKKIVTYAYIFQSFPYVFLQYFQGFRSYTKIFDSFGVDLCRG